MTPGYLNDILVLSKECTYDIKYRQNENNYM